MAVTEALTKCSNRFSMASRSLALRMATPACPARLRARRSWSGPNGTTAAPASVSAMRLMNCSTPSTSPWVSVRGTDSMEMER